MSPRAARAVPGHGARAVWRSAPEQQAARFHRERDRGRLLVMARTLMSAVVLVALVLAVVGLRVQQVRLSYRLDGLRAARTQLEESRGRLRVELATLHSLARIEGKARQELGMVPPTAEQVQVAREFVPGGGGLSMATPLTASAQGAPRLRAGAR